MGAFQGTRLRARMAVFPASALPEGTRRRILEVALRLFASEGFHGTSIRDIARAVELQPSALYVHFPSKEHLLAELVRVAHEAHEAMLKESQRDVGDDPVEKLRALVRAHTIIHATYPHLAVIVNEEIRSLTTELAAPALDARKRSSDLLRRVIDEGIARGCFSPPDKVVTMAAISGMGVRIPYWYEAGEDLDIERLADIHVELSLRLLCPRERSGSH